MELFCTGKDQWNPTEHVHSIVIEHSPDGSYLSPIFLLLCGRKQGRLIADNIQRLISQHDNLIKVLPRIIKRLVIGTPPMLVHGIPEATIIPVAASNRNHRLIGGQRIIIVNATAGALDALTLVSSTYIIIERSHGIDINIRCRAIDGILVQLILRMFVQAGCHRQCRQQQK